MRRTMRILFISLILGSVWAGKPVAHGQTFDFGLESHVSRDVVRPSLFTFFNTGLQGTSEKTEYDLRLRIHAEHPTAMAVTSKNFYYRISGQENPIQSSIGRKWVSWSEGDEIWGLGILNPLDAWDRLRSKSQGLTGLFFQGGGESVQWDLFASYLMVPEIMPNVVIENEQFKFYHPQSVSSGPQTFDLLGKPTPLGYRLALPGLDTILLRPSFLGSISTKNTHSNLNARTTLGYLPLNYFPVALDASLSIPINTIVVNLRPRILYHAVYSGEVSYRLANDQIIGFSVIKDQIITEKAIPSEYTTAALGTTIHYIPWIKIGSFRLSHIYSEGGLGADIGSNVPADPNQNLFSSRILYRNATQFTFEWNELNFRVLREHAVRANWVAMDWNHQWDANWNTVLGGDLLSAEKLNAADRGAEFLPDLRAVDRIRLGVKYVF